MTVDSPAPTSFYQIPGWFRWLDMTMFEALLEAQAGSAPGVLVEMGTYLGKSAVIIGQHVRAEDRFVAIDLFGDTDLLGLSAPDQANRRESQKSYKTLTRRQFESNYLALHPELPDIIQGPSSMITDHVAPGTARFVHVDASHMYEHVRVDAANTKALLRPGGIAVFDDFRSEHTPGVSAAVWEAVFTGGLVPLAVSTQKFYGTYDDPEPYREVLRDLFSSDTRYQWEEQHLAGHAVLRARMVQTPKAAPTKPGAAPSFDVDRLAEQLAKRLDPILDRTLEPVRSLAASETFRRVPGPLARRLRSLRRLL